MALSGAAIGGISAAASGGDGWDILQGSMLGFGAGMVVGAAPFALQGFFSGGGAAYASAASAPVTTSTASVGGGLYDLGKLLRVGTAAANSGKNLYDMYNISRSQQYAAKFTDRAGGYFLNGAQGGGSGGPPNSGSINTTRGSGSSLSPNAARRAAMRMNNSPTSRPAVSQSGSAGNRQYETTGSDGKPRVQTQHPADSKHPSPHVHDAMPKVDPRTGEMLRNKYGQIKYGTDGSFVPYE